MEQSRAKLFIVATPLGNLDDLSSRAIKVLTDADLIAAEDTRRTRQLLNKFNIKTDLTSYYDQIEKGKASHLISKILDGGLNVALVSDGGTPCISDPGYQLVKLAHERGVPVVPIPGPSAVATIASVSGLPTDRFLFVGFLPTKASHLEEEMRSWSGFVQNVVFYESPHRIENTLDKLAEIYPDAWVTVGRELTKLHEEIASFPLADMKTWLAGRASEKGEFSVYASLNWKKSDAYRKDLSEEEIREIARKEFRDGRTLKELLQWLRMSSLPKAVVYKLLLGVKAELEKEEDNFE
ncbi:MAG: 16S rRNA (cytidine(1402)-2'-O)-methyltransferase [Oligoflexales bacterium]